MRLFLEPWVSGTEFFWECKKGVLNYVIMRPTMALVTLLTSWAGVYQGGSLSLTNAYPYITLVCNLSQAWSLYCLVRVL